MFIHNLTNHSFNIGGRYHANHFGGWCGRDLRIWRCDCMYRDNHTDYAIPNQKKKEIGSNPFLLAFAKFTSHIMRESDSLTDKALDII